MAYPAKQHTAGFKLLFIFLSNDQQAQAETNIFVRNDHIASTNGPKPLFR